MDDDILSSRKQEEYLSSQPYRRLEFAVIRIVDVAIPFHLKALEKQLELIEDFQIQGRWALVRAEEVKASNTVRLLKSDIHELEQLNAQLRPEDAELFHKKIRIPTQKVVETLVSFLEIHGDVMQPLHSVDEDGEVEIPALKCNLELEGEPQSSNLDDHVNCNVLKQEVLQVDESKFTKQWMKLKNEIVEVNELIKKFAGFVWSQKESVDQIENNALSAHLNVHEGTKSLKQAVLLKTAAIPVTGALIGGLVFGPVGAIAGFKLCGTVACALSGSVLGYGAGMKWKKHNQSSCEFEMKALTAPESKLCSTSLPDLSRTDCVATNDSVCKPLSVS